ncbi:hypothetical protein CN085_33150 [Sinorhizobium meliloti]|uniref:UvrD-helicase domain-containing protein n=1 Tax=Rhizobium meliloti TaxID=382 RepID=UPI000FDB302B|nr:UvrD-helicase domain-containing protein [Sinorhizobium meliloti]RVP06370.1 hypothetical protein CN085_33150 [Sinorhizobium meliloti]
MKLTPQQQLALDHPGNLLLKACPGSGKTRTIVAKLVNEMEEVRGMPIPMKPPLCSEMIAPPVSGMISPPV